MKWMIHKGPLEYKHPSLKWLSWQLATGKLGLGNFIPKTLLSEKMRPVFLGNRERTKHHSVQHIRMQR